MNRDQRVAPTIGCLALLVSLCCGPVVAQPPVTVEGAWLRAAPPGARVMAGYLVLRNHTRRPLALTGVASPRFTRVELHRSELVDGVARMHAVERVEVPARGSVALAPGGTHLMLVEPTGAVGAGQSVELTLSFDNGWTIETEAPVR